MNREDAEDRPKELVQTGYIHMAFSTGSREKVDELTARLKADGYTVLSGPRVTGDGYYESYDNHGADVQKIISCAEENGLNEEKAWEVIHALESVKCIIMENGEYKLTETIVLNLRN